MGRVVFLPDHEVPHFLVRHSFRRWGIADDLALVKCPDAIDEAFDDFHIVFDEHDRRFFFPQGLHDDVHKAEFLFHANPAGRLVEHHQFRITHCRHGDIQQFADTLRQG